MHMMAAFPALSEIAQKSKTCRRYIFGVICYNGLAFCSCKSGSTVCGKVFFLGRGQEAEVYGAGC